MDGFRGEQQGGTQELGGPGGESRERDRRKSCLVFIVLISSYHLHDAFTVVAMGYLQQLPEMNETLFVSF